MMTSPTQPTHAAPTVESRASFHRDLEALENQMLVMASRAREALASSLRALADRDAERFQMVVADDDAIDSLCRQIEHDAVNLLARQQPVAGDLRLLVALIHAWPPP